jgi:transposase-like protein
MSIMSHLHHLFNADTCQSYIHTLRWKDRPLQCPRCQSLNVGPWGAYHAQPGLKRYRCKEQGCKRTFNDLTGTLLDGSKRSVMHWILATFLLCLSCSSRRIARELGVHIRTSYRWCWWLRNAALSYEMERQLEGTVEADDKPRQHLVYLSVHVSRPCWIGGRPLISMIGLAHDADTFCLYAAPLLVKPRPIE